MFYFIILFFCSMPAFSTSHNNKLTVMKDWNKEGLFLAKALRIPLPKSSRDRSSFWPGAFIGEENPDTRVFSMRKPFPPSPFPLTFDQPNEDYYYFHSLAEEWHTGIAMHVLLKKRWCCWWPSYGQNYPVLRLFWEKPLYPQRELVRSQGGRATFSYDPWVHEFFRFRVDSLLLSASLFFEAAVSKDLVESAAEGGHWLPEGVAVKQPPLWELVPSPGREAAFSYDPWVHVRSQGGRATFSYDPWVHESFGFKVADLQLSFRFWEFTADVFKEKAPPMVNFIPLLPKYSAIIPKRFTLEQILKLKKEYEDQFEYYDPNIIDTPGGRPVLEAEIINFLVPSIKNLGWHNYPSPMHLRTCSDLWKEAPYFWHSHPLDYQTWRAKHIEDWRIKKYFSKLHKNLRRAERYAAKKKKQADSLAVWREENREEWLAFVRDDPRQNYQSAQYDIADFNEVIPIWRGLNDELKLYRGF